MINDHNGGWNNIFYAEIGLGSYIIAIDLCSNITLCVPNLASVSGDLLTLEYALFYLFIQTVTIIILL